MFSPVTYNAAKLDAFQVFKQAEFPHSDVRKSAIATCGQFTVTAFQQNNPLCEWLSPASLLLRRSCVSYWFRHQLLLLTGRSWFQSNKLFRKHRLWVELFFSEKRATFWLKWLKISVLLWYILHQAKYSISKRLDKVFFPLLRISHLFHCPMCTALSGKQLHCVDADGLKTANHFAVKPHNKM